jgi:hypothetical protein
MVSRGETRFWASTEAPELVSPGEINREGSDEPAGLVSLTASSGSGRDDEEAGHARAARESGVVEASGAAVVMGCSTEKTSRPPATSAR